MTRIYSSLNGMQVTRCSNSE